MNMKKKKIIAISIACLIAAGAVVAWLAHPRRVVVGFANTPEFMYSRIAQSADAENVEIRKVKNVKEYAGCDAVFTFGMGLDWGEEERAAVQKLMDKGLKHMTLMAPNADNNISNLDSTQQYTFLEFFDNGGTANFRNALYYVRENVLGKKLRNGAALGEVIRYGSDVLFSKDSDDLAFNSVKEYEAYYREHGMKPGKPKVAVFTSIISPFNSDRQYLNEILQGLENVGFNVYGVSAWTQKLEILQEISPRGGVPPRTIRHGELAGPNRLAKDPQHPHACAPNAHHPTQRMGKRPQRHGGRLLEPERGGARTRRGHRTLRAHRAGGGKWASGI